MYPRPRWRPALVGASLLSLALLVSQTTGSSNPASFGNAPSSDPVPDSVQMMAIPGEPDDRFTVPSPGSTPDLASIPQSATASRADSPDFVVTEADLATVAPSLATPTPKSTPDPTPKPAPKATPKPKAAPAAPRVGSSYKISGKASWYCKAGASACHYAYPSSSMAAAACLPLRKALGANWRGKWVGVSGNGRTVKVKLVDSCASPTKTIDLYAAPFSKLASLSSGVVSVTIRW